MAARAKPDDLLDPLQRLGARRVEAALLACLLDQGPLGTKDIVARTGLRQPEVSVGMQTLRDRGWVEAESIPRKGKGRPMHRYALVVPPVKVRGFYEAEGRSAIKENQEAIKALKDRLG